MLPLKSAAMPSQVAQVHSSYCHSQEQVKEYTDRCSFQNFQKGFETCSCFTSTSGGISWVLSTDTPLLTDFLINCCLLSLNLKLEFADGTVDAMPAFLNPCTISFMYLLLFICGFSCALLHNCSYVAGSLKPLKMSMTKACAPEPVKPNSVNHCCNTLTFRPTDVPYGLSQWGVNSFPLVLPLIVTADDDLKSLPSITGLIWNSNSWNWLIIDLAVRHWILTPYSESKSAFQLELPCAISLKKSRPYGRAVLLSVCLHDSYLRLQASQTRAA